MKTVAIILKWFTINTVLKNNNQFMAFIVNDI